MNPVISMASAFRLAVFGVALLASTQQAFAQDSRVTGRMDEAYPTTVRLTGSLEGGHGGDPALATNEERRSDEGVYTGGQLALTFTKRLKSITFGVDAAGVVRYYQDTQRLANVGEHAAVSLDARFGKSQLTFRQTARVTPFQQLLQLIDGAEEAITLPVTSPDLAVLTAPNTTFETMVGYTRPISRRAEVQFRYGFEESRQGSRVDRRMFTLGGVLRRNFSRSFDLRLGHTAWLMRGAAEAAAPDLMGHDLDVGVDYRRPLSFSRRSTVAFSTGAAAATTELATDYMVTGAASLQHALGRTWNASVTFDRRLSVMEGIPQPVAANTLNTALGGMFGRHMGVRVRTSSILGRIGLSARAGAGVPANTTAFTTESRVFVIFWRRWQWYAEHYYYQHALSNPEILAQTVAPRLTRGGLRTGIDLQVTVLRRRR